MCMTSLPHMFLLLHMFTTSLPHMFFTAARDLDLCQAVACHVEHSRVEQLFVCTQKMKPLEKPVKTIRAVSFFVSSSWFRQKSVAQTRVKQSHFEQMIMTQKVECKSLVYSFKRNRNLRNRNFSVVYIIKELLLKQCSKFYASGGNVAKLRG